MTSPALGASNSCRQALADTPRPCQRGLVELPASDLHRHLREATGEQTFNPGFTKQDRSRFLGALENEVQAMKRRSAKPLNPEQE